MPTSATATPLPTTSTKGSRVLVCDDEKNMRRLLEDVLSDDGWAVTTVPTGEDLLDRFRRGEEFDAIVLDLSLPGMNGLETMEKLRPLAPTARLVVITAYGSVDAAVRAMQLGAVDFLIKPFDNSRLKAVLRRIRDAHPPVAARPGAQPLLIGAEGGVTMLLGTHPRMLEIASVVRQVASLKSSVMIYGESGTGKELVAHAIHFNGDRRTMPMVAVNCAAVAESLLESEFFGHEKGAYTSAHASARGKFELADRGTLFLDEIGEMSLPLQAKLLRVLQSGTFSRVGGEKELTVDVRIIAATNRDLEEMVERKAFREDLYYRLNVIPLTLPPLRERTADIPDLANFMIRKFAERHHLPPLLPTSAQMDQIVGYHWPGNIRELQNTIEKATILKDAAVIGAHIEGVLNRRKSSSSIDGVPVGAFRKRSLPPELTPDDYVLKLGEAATVRELNEVSADAQRAAVIRALRLCAGNKSEAAKRLGISYKTLFNKLEDLNIELSTGSE